MLQPVVRRTWAPRGQTPIQYSWDRRDRLSVISAITASPQRRRLGLYFNLFDHNIIADDVQPFVATLLVHFPKGIILVWDRWMVHRSAARQLAQRFERRLAIEWLPAYAPELNPVEPLWDYIDDTSLANTPMDNLQRLRYRVVKGVSRVNRQPNLGRGFLKYTKLF